MMMSLKVLKTQYTMRRSNSTRGAREWSKAWIGVHFCNRCRNAACTVKTVLALECKIAPGTATTAYVTCLRGVPVGTDSSTCCGRRRLAWAHLYVLYRGVPSFSPKFTLSSRPFVFLFPFTRIQCLQCLSLHSIFVVTPATEPGVSSTVPHPVYIYLYL